MPTAFGIAACAVRARIPLPDMTDQEVEALASDPVFVRKVGPIIRWLIRMEETNAIEKGQKPCNR